MPCPGIVLVVLWCICLARGARDSDRWVEHNHFVSMDCYACSLPQPRIFRVQDLVEPGEWKSKYEDKRELIVPPASVLHRCDSAGFCAKWDHQCVNVSSEYVDLTFAIQPDVQLNPKKGTLKFFTLPSNVNHTRCACVKV